MESIKERVDARGVSGYIAAAAAHQHGAVTDDEQQAALDRIAAIEGLPRRRPRAP